MVDLTAIASAATSLKTAGEIAKAMLGIRDGAMIQAKVIELQSEILSAQSSALAAQAEQFALLERVRDLEKRMAEMKAWDTEREKYELKRIGAGTFAYMQKAGMSQGQPTHWLCAACYEHSRKAILQRQGQQGRDVIFGCPECKNTLSIPWGQVPSDF